jgi:hypothetical protein
MKIHCHIRLRSVRTGTPFLLLHFTSGILIMGVRLTYHWISAAFTCLLFVSGWEWKSGWVKELFFSFRKYGAQGGIILTGENRRTRRKTCPSAIFSITNPTGLTRARTRTAAVRSRRLTVWAMAQPWSVHGKHLLRGSVRGQAIMIAIFRFFQSLQTETGTVSWNMTHTLPRWSLLDHYIWSYYHYIRHWTRMLNSRSRQNIFNSIDVPQFGSLTRDPVPRHVCMWHLSSPLAVFPQPTVSINNEAETWDDEREKSFSLLFLVSNLSSFCAVCTLFFVWGYYLRTRLTAHAHPPFLLPPPLLPPSLPWVALLNSRPLPCKTSFGKHSLEI